MFDDTWKWAGQFRKTEKNIGVAPSVINIELKKLMDDTCYQLENKIYSIDEIAYRFHHRLVSIHPFANGNGRHARLMTDLILIQKNKPRFTWGKQRLITEGSNTEQYIQSLRRADKRDYTHRTSKCEIYAAVIFVPRTRLKRR